MSLVKGIDDLVIAYLSAVAIWSFVMAWFVGKESITRSVKSGKSRLYNALIGLFRQVFREEMKGQREALVSDFKKEIPKVPTVAEIVAALPPMPKVPTGAEVWASMKEEVLKSIVDAGEIDLEAIGKALQDAVVTQIKAIKFDLAPLVAAIMPEIKKQIEELSLDELYKAMAKRARDGKNKKQEGRAEAIEEIITEALDNPDEVKIANDLYATTAPLLKRAGVDEAEIIEATRAVIRGRRLAKTIGEKKTSSSSGGAVPEFAR